MNGLFTDYAVAPWISPLCQWYTKDIFLFSISIERFQQTQEVQIHDWYSTRIDLADSRKEKKIKKKKKCAKFAVRSNLRAAKL